MNISRFNKSSQKFRLKFVFPYQRTPTPYQQSIIPLSFSIHSYHIVQVAVQIGVRSQDRRLHHVTENIDTCKPFRFHENCITSLDY